jgi:pyrimidine deaminase RibD-like protein
VAGYSEALAQRILSALEEGFPMSVSSQELKTRVSDFAEVPDEEWLLALDGLYKRRFVAGKPYQTGFRQTLRGIANLEITQLGREWLHNARAQQPVSAADADRKFARLAIDEARKSIPESDGRPHPRVGAVVVKNGKILSAAHRGELPANHAEYIALEKKLSDEAVAGATVYTTLEPCTTRNHPKIPCAERLIERKVRRVVIGMLDPDERITGRGQRKLRAAGIITDLFPHDLMTEAEELNRDFTRSCEQQSQALQTHAPSTGPSVRECDPRVYLEVLESGGGSVFSKTPFVLHNRGGDVAHDVRIHPIKLKTSTITFESVGALAPGNKGQVLPCMEGAGALAPHNIAHWLHRDWDSNGQLVEEWSVCVRITYEDFAKKHFETALDLVYLPVKATFRDNHTAWGGDDSAVFQLRNFEFRRLD